MLLRLIALLTHSWLRGLGYQRLRRRIGEWDVVFYRKRGRGEPWVLLHGLGSNAVSWAPVARYLAPRSRVLIPELSRIGGTRGPKPALAVREGAAVVAELLRRELSGEPATVVGMSLGGWTAVHLALAEPSLVSRLILVDAAGYRDQDWDTIRRLVTVDDQADVERLYAALFRHVPWTFRWSRAAFLKVYRSPAVRSVLDELAEGDLFGPEHLARLEMPVGVLWAEHDGLFSADVGRQIARHLRQGAFFLIPGVGHGVHWEDPERLVAAMQQLRLELPARATQPVSSVATAGR